MNNKTKKKKINQLPYGRHCIDDQDIEAVVEVLKGDFLTSGPKSNEFELEFSKYIKSKYSVVFSSGTAALHMAGIALGIQKGDTVIVPAITFLASANAFKYLGANVIFADVDPLTGLMMPEKLERLILNNKKEKIKAVISVHLNGQPTDLENIFKITKKYNLIHIEDACHALGGTYKNTKIGECIFSDVTMFSFHPVKLLAMGEGGIISTNSKIISEKLKLLRNHGIEKRPQKFLNKDLAFDNFGNPNPWYYEMQCLGYNYRASDIHCALGLSQLKKVDKFLKKRQNLTLYYNEKFFNLNVNLKTIEKVKWGTSGHHLYVIQIDFDESKISKSNFMSNLQKRGINTQVHYVPLIYQPFYKNEGLKNFPGAISYYEKSLSIPLFPLMNNSDVDFVVKNIKDLLNFGI